MRRREKQKVAALASAHEAVVLGWTFPAFEVLRKGGLHVEVGEGDSEPARYAGQVARYVRGSDLGEDVGGYLSVADHAAHSAGGGGEGRRGGAAAVSSAAALLLLLGVFILGGAAAAAAADTYRKKCRNVVQIKETAIDGHVFLHETVGREIE